MTKAEIEHMWKVASHNPNHDTNWYDPAIERFAWLVQEHEREACANAVLAIANDDAGNPYKQAMRIGAEAIRARGQA